MESTCTFDAWIALYIFLSISLGLLSILISIGFLTKWKDEFWIQFSIVYGFFFFIGFSMLLCLFISIISFEYECLEKETSYIRIPLKKEFSYIKQKYYDIGYCSCKNLNIEVNPPYYLEPYNKAWQEGRRRKIKEFKTNLFDIEEKNATLLTTNETKRGQ